MFDVLRGIEHLPKIPKEFKGNQWEIKGNVKGNQRKCKAKSKEIKGNVKGIFGRCPNLPKNIEKLIFLTSFFESRGKDLIYPFLAFRAGGAAFIGGSPWGYFFLILCL